MGGRQRAVAGLTGLAVAVLAGVFCFLSWDRANQVAGIVSALVGVVALGTGVLALVSGRDGSVRVVNTGPATAVGAGSHANTGLTAQGGVRGGMEVDGTAEARAEDGGRANTGYDQL
ncbi:hypothetical protein AB0N88_03710 [Streptomyces sp. NPDC093516]|uniref:Uncharacterized protein n=1 Tax=Streptomyces coeruleorubidus TaxID=116188 RepID=A0ABZ0KFN0_STRC4|nr:hypothetical protein [Streptomyces coeruleorubidus]WOT36820.1 hypothetical protein R5U08_23020 [Streptomyces coeruleorubidus]